MFGELPPGCGSYGHKQPGVFGVGRRSGTTDGARLLAPAAIDGTTALYAITTDGSGMFAHRSATGLLPRHRNHPAVGRVCEDRSNPEVMPGSSSVYAEAVPQTKSRVPVTASTLGQTA